MSGILGVWNLDGRPIEPTLLSQLAKRLAHRGPDGEGLYADGSVGLASRLFRVTPESAAETQPFVHSSGVVVVFDGRLDNREDLLASLDRQSGIRSSSSRMNATRSAAFAPQYPAPPSYGPSAARVRAVAAPIPLLAPVTRAVGRVFGDTDTGSPQFVVVGPSSLSRECGH